MDLDCSGLQSLEAANRCGMRNVPSAATTEADTRWFIKYVSMDLYGADHWYCSGLEQLNRYTFTGSYYYAYVKMASCSVPTGWRATSDLRLRGWIVCWPRRARITVGKKTGQTDNTIPLLYVFRYRRGHRNIGLITSRSETNLANRSNLKL